MDKENALFLAQLAKELKEQETDCQASPRYWGILEDVTQYGFTEEYGGNQALSLDNEIYISLEDAKGAAQEALSYKYDKTDSININEIITCTDIESIVNILNESNIYAEICYYKVIPTVTQQTGCFLTKKAAKQHISQNYYHYDNPRTYAMTAWRNAEFEKVINILTNTDWEAEISK